MSCVQFPNITTAVSSSRLENVRTYANFWMSGVPVDQACGDIGIAGLRIVQNLTFSGMVAQVRYHNIWKHVIW